LREVPGSIPGQTLSFALEAICSFCLSCGDEFFCGLTLEGGLVGELEGRAGELHTRHEIEMKVHNCLGLDRMIRSEAIWVGKPVLNGEEAYFNAVVL